MPALPASLQIGGGLTLAFDGAAWLPALPPFLLASVACLVLTPLTMILARRVGAIAIPEGRHIHDQPTPRLGGLALCAGFAIALLVFGAGIPNRTEVLVATAAVTLVMALDDVVKLPWWGKLGVELGAGGLVAGLGIAITFVALPGGHIVDLAWFAVPVTIAYLVGMQNAINLLDGVDGVAAGVVAIVAGVLMLAAVNRLGPGGDVQGNVIVMSGALMGCCVGFLVLNFAPARVFMGDSGAHFLGLALGVITILGVAKVAVALSIGVPLVALALPIGDTAFAIVRRSRAGTSLAEADADHLHHRLLRRGLSARETAIAFYLATAILGCIGLAVFGHKKVLAVAVALLAAALVALVWRNRRQASVGALGSRLIASGRAAPPARLTGNDAGARVEETPPVAVPGGGVRPARAQRGGEID